jgi:hypothetical protein
MNPARGLEARRARAARNQSVFREVNERIEEFRSTAAAFVEFVCECALERCTEHVSLTLEEYERIRLDSNRFLVLPGHVIPRVEKVIEETDRYLVVSKLGSGASVAAELDPRRRRTRP